MVASWSDSNPHTKEASSVLLCVRISMTSQAQLAIKYFWKIIMCANIKSCVSNDGMMSDFFSSGVGVRQGENLSPILFALFVNDLQTFLN